jgi:protein-histidine pros-kinase
MNLLARFSVIFLLVFVPGLLLVGYFSRSFLEEQAREEVHEQARLMMETALAARHYTTAHIQPILAAADKTSGKFHAETVPAFAATELFLYLRQANTTYSDYEYKEAVLNPTNPRDQARGWEEDLIRDFRNHPEQKKINGQRPSPTGDMIYLAHPLVVSEQCLTCHGLRDEAPPEMIKEYSLAGSNNGFGWKTGEVIGAQIVSVPASKPITVAGQAFRKLMLWLVIGALLTLMILDATLYFAVIRPIQRIAANADAISKGQTGIPELPVEGAKEISVLATAFNRMHRSLTKAMKLIE